MAFAGPVSFDREDGSVLVYESSPEDEIVLEQPELVQRHCKRTRVMEDGECRSAGRDGDALQDAYPTGGFRVLRSGETRPKRVLKLQVGERQQRRRTKKARALRKRVAREWGVAGRRPSREKQADIRRSLAILPWVTPAIEGEDLGTVARLYEEEALRCLGTVRSRKRIDPLSDVTPKR